MTSKPPSDDPDRDILALVAAGQLTPALTELMARHGDEVYRFCSQQLGDHTLADDVQQQVFEGAFHHLPRFERKSKLRTWLFAIARHRVLDAVKARTRARNRVSDLASADDTPGEDSRLDIRIRTRLAEALDQLDPKVRSAVLLHHQQGFTFDELAEMTGEKPGTVCARVSRALEDLRAYLVTGKDRRRRGVLHLAEVTR